MNFYPYEEDSFLFSKKSARNVFIVLVLLFFSIYIGSEQFGYFDMALYGYLFSIELVAKITKITREDMVFVPYHWGKELAINHLTNPALEPKSKIPEFKVCAVKLEKTSAAVGENHG